MKVTPHAKLEEYAREEYRRHFASIPEPVPVNIEAVVAFNKPRVIPWGALRYRMRPLSYAQGFNLQVAANAIRTRRLAGESTEDQRRAALRLIRPLLHPTNPLRRFKRVPYFAAPDFAIERLIGAMIYVPDDGAVAPPSRPMRVDLMDEMATFAHQLPAWCEPAYRWLFRNPRAGQPLSWAHYVYGSRHLSRDLARADLRMAVAMRMAQADKDGWKLYETEQRSAANWVH